MGAPVFISYRRADTAGYAFTLFRELKRIFGDDAIFYDGKSIDSGMDFPDRIEQGVFREEFAATIADLQQRYPA